MAETIAKDAEGASLGQAKPDETLRQKDPVPTHSGKFVLWQFELPSKSCWSNDTDGVRF